MQVAAGTRLGNYQIVAALGAGGMGEVYRAHDLRLGRDVALKLLPDTHAALGDSLVRFEREARILAGLNHPNLVTLHSIEEADGWRFLTMELVEGRTLAELIPAGGQPFTEVMAWLLPLVEALSAAHGQGVIHRDLKPANVMLTPTGRVKVLDFGLAKLTEDRAERERLRAGTLANPRSAAGALYGTVPYMAPEQIFGETIDARSDLFALGVLTYEALAGHRPFPGETVWEIAGSIMRDEPVSLTAVRADVPAGLAGIVARCLQKQPADRFQTATELLKALHEMERGMTPASSGAGMPGVAAVSVAVLPFANRSPDPDDAYFSDGLADELLDLLAKIKGLRVSARASSFQFRGKDLPLAEIGRSLNVATVLDGSVRRSGNRVRISVQLVNVHDGYSLWAETYDRTLDDMFAVQDEIAHAVVTELRATLLRDSGAPTSSGGVRAEVGRAGRGRGTDAEAHRLYLLARYLVEQYNRDATVKAIGYLTDAVGRDPEFALAWWMLSVANFRGWGLSLVPDGANLARGAVERALLLEPELAEGHAQLANIRLFHDWDWAGAEASMARALDLASGSVEIRRQSGVLASAIGSVEVAIQVFQRILEQDPLNAAALHSLGVALLALDRATPAEAAFRRALELVPQRIATHGHLALAILADGRPAEALEEAGREPENGYRLWAESIIQFQGGMPARSAETLRRLVEGGADPWSIQIAEVHAARGEADAAFEWLAHAHGARDPGLAFVRNNPRLRKLHADPRWDAFLGLMGFER